MTTPSTRITRLASASVPYLKVVKGTEAAVAEDGTIYHLVHKSHSLYHLLLLSNGMVIGSTGNEYSATIRFEAAITDSI